MLFQQKTIPETITAPWSKAEVATSRIAKAILKGCSKIDENTLVNIVYSPCLENFDSLQVPHKPEMEAFVSWIDRDTNRAEFDLAYKDWLTVAESYRAQILDEYTTWCKDKGNEYWIKGEFGDNGPGGGSADPTNEHVVEKLLSISEYPYLKDSNH